MQYALVVSPPGPKVVIQSYCPFYPNTPSWISQGPRWLAPKGIFLRLFTDVFCCKYNFAECRRYEGTLVLADPVSEDSRYTLL